MISSANEQLHKQIDAALEALDNQADDSKKKAMALADALVESLSKVQESYQTHFNLAVLYTMKEQWDLALDELETATEGGNLIMQAKSDETLEPLKAHSPARWNAILARFGPQPAESFLAELDAI